MVKEGILYKPDWITFLVKPIFRICCFVRANNACPMRGSRTISSNSSTGSIANEKMFSLCSGALKINRTSFSWRKAMENPRKLTPLGQNKLCHVLE